MVTRVLVAEDDPTVSEVLVRYLEREGFVVDAVADGLAALEQAQRALPDLVVLDLMLPRLDGFEVCRRLREQSPVPVIMLTARGEEDDRVAGLDIGADDYVTKPFSPRELTSRVKAVLRRSQVASVPAPDGQLVAGDLVVDLAAHEVRLADDPVSLTAKEFELLAFLASRPRQVFDRETLLREVWNWTYGDAATVTVHIRRLREKIEADPSKPSRIVTVWGVGYRFDP